MFYLYLRNRFNNFHNKLNLYMKRILFITKEALDNFAKNNYNEFSELKSTRENLWKRYHRVKTEETWC